MTKQNFSTFSTVMNRRNLVYFFVFCFFCNLNETFPARAHRGISFILGKACGLGHWSNKGTVNVMKPMQYRAGFLKELKCFPDFLPIIYLFLCGEIESLGLLMCIKSNENTGFLSIWLET